jgi:hypothetical protein
LEREGSGETSGRQGCPQGRGEVLAGPATVSEHGVEVRRSKRRQKLSAALMPDGPAHHLESSQPHPREGHQTPRRPAGQPNWLASCPPTGVSGPSTSIRGQVAMGRDETGRRRLVWEAVGVVVPRRKKNRFGNRRLGAEPMAPSGALPCVIGAPGCYHCPSPSGRRAPSKADPLGGDQHLGSSPKASDPVSCASAAPRPRCSARATRAGCRSESHHKNWGAKRRRGHPY